MVPNFCILYIYIYIFILENADQNVISQLFNALVNKGLSENEAHQVLQNVAAALQNSKYGMFNCCCAQFTYDSDADQCHIVS